MKKYILITSIIFFVGSSLYSQAKLEIGLKAGANFSKLSTDASDFDLKNSTGYIVGAFTLIKVANIGIQPEVNYSLQGTTFKDIGDEFKQDLYYLNIPLMAKFYLPLGLNLQAGPQYGILVSAKSDGEDIKNQFKDSDITAVLGAGWDLPFGLKVSARYLIGLNDINDGSVDQGEKLKNRTWQLALGYSIFKIGK